MSRCIFIGQFKNGKLFNQIGKAVPVPSAHEEKDALIALIDWLVCEIDKHYESIDGEYIAYDFMELIP
jgi:hypothetical protein